MKIADLVFMYENALTADQQTLSDAKSAGEEANPNYVKSLEDRVAENELLVSQLRTLLPPSVGN